MDFVAKFIDLLLEVAWLNMLLLDGYVQLCQVKLVTKHVLANSRLDLSGFVQAVDRRQNA